MGSPRAVPLVELWVQEVWGGLDGEFRVDGADFCDFDDRVLEDSYISSRLIYMAVKALAPFSMNEKRYMPSLRIISNILPPVWSTEFGVRSIAMIRTSIYCLRGKSMMTDASGFNETVCPFVE